MVFSSSEQCPEGIVAIAGNTLRILALEKLGAIFNQGTVYQSVYQFFTRPRTVSLGPLVFGAKVEKGHVVNAKKFEIH